MPTSCTICNHPKRKAIERAIAAGVPLRDIVGQYGGSRGSISRHTSNCLAKALGKAGTARKVVKAAQEDAELAVFKEAVTEVARRDAQSAVTVEMVVSRLFDVLLKLLDACDRDLTDPDDPQVYNLMPRAQEIQIVWEKNEAAKGEKPRWVKKQSTLQAVLDLAFSSENRKLVRDAPVAHNDRTKVLLDVTDRLGKQAEFLAKLEGRFLKSEKPAGEGTTIQLAWITQILIQEGLLKE